LEKQDQNAAVAIQSQNEKTRQSAIKFANGGLIANN
jgi:hypothetical protein